MSDDDKTPVIEDPDPRWKRRAGELDWSRHEGYKNQVQCIYAHPPYRSYAKYVQTYMAMIAQEPCPTCGTHHLSRMSVRPA